MLLSIFKISGHSMMPALKPRDRVIVSSIPFLFSKPKVGDIILFKYNSKIMIKRIKKFEKDRVTVTGDNSSDSLKIAPTEGDFILGKVIFILNT